MVNDTVIRIVFVIGVAGVVKTIADYPCEKHIF